MMTFGPNAKTLQLLTKHIYQEHKKMSREGESNDKDKKICRTHETTNTILMQPFNESSKWSASQSGESPGAHPGGWQTGEIIEPF